MRIFTLSIAVLGTAILLRCAEGGETHREQKNPAGDATQNGINSAIGPQIGPQGGGSPTPTPNPSSSQNSSPTPTAVASGPHVFDSSTVKIVNSAGKHCPDDYAVFAIDDSATPTLACFPLPSSDILIKGISTDRVSTCLVTEVITGVAANGTGVACTPINTTKYSLTIGSACGFGSGTGGNYATCPTLPSNFTSALAPSFGIDGCAASVLGQIFTKRGGSTCNLDAAYTLIEKNTGTAVVIVKP